MRTGSTTQTSSSGDARASRASWRRGLTRAALAAGVTAGALTGLGTAAQAGDEPTPKIIGGQPADQTYSFMASLQYLRDGNPDSHRCGGALIKKDWVVTAAHCVTTAGVDGANFTVMDPALFHVRVGTKDRTSGGGVAKVASITVKPEYKVYDDKGSGDDVALLKLDTALTQAPVALAPKITKPGTKVRQIGWGYTSTEDDDPSKLPTQLQQLDTRTLPPTTQKCITGTDGTDAWGIRAGDVCTDNPEGVRGPCNGDSGSPLLTKVAGRWQLEGVDSRAPADICGQAPDIYTSVGYHRAWLTGVIG